MAVQAQYLDPQKNNKEHMTIIAENANIDRSNAYYSEIYTKNPKDLSVDGWEIHVDTVYANTKQEGKEAVKEVYGKLFDCFILFYCD